MIEQVLIQNGLTEKEAKVYLSILGAGEATISLIADRSHLKRTSVYDIIDVLKESGIVSITKRRGVQYVSALSPRNLIDRFKQAATFAEEALPALMEMAYSSPLKPRMRFYEGISGLQEILREMSYSRGQTTGFTDYERMPRELVRCIRKEIIPERRKRKNFIRLVVPRNDANLRVKTEDHLWYGEHRIVDFPEKKSHIEILLFDLDKIGFLSFAEKEEFGVVLHSQAVYETLKNLFLLVWERATA